MNQVVHTFPNTFECSICLCDIESESAKYLSCDPRHVFHKLCIDRWLNATPSCPICRASVPRPLADVTDLVALASDLGLPPVDVEVRSIFFLSNPPPGAYLYHNHISGSHYAISARNTLDWVPQQWMDELALFPSHHPTVRLLERINSGVSALIMTRNYRRPKNLRVCEICNDYITNMSVALSVHNGAHHNNE